MTVKKPSSAQQILVLALTIQFTVFSQHHRRRQTWLNTQQPHRHRKNNKDPLQGQDYSWAESPSDSTEKRAQSTQSSCNLETLTHCKCLDLSLHHFHTSPALSSPPLSIYLIEPNTVSAQLVKPSEFPLKIWHPSSSPWKWLLLSVFTACLWFTAGLKLYHFYRFQLRLKTKIYGSLKNRPDSQLLVQ